LAKASQKKGWNNYYKTWKVGKSISEKRMVELLQKVKSEQKHLRKEGWDNYYKRWKLGKSISEKRMAQLSQSLKRGKAVSEKNDGTTLTTTAKWAKLSQKRRME
jgi:hypothetical protein